MKTQRNCRLKYRAKLACKAFKSAANEEKENLYEDFSHTDTEDRSLQKFWKLHQAMNVNRTQTYQTLE